MELTSRSKLLEQMLIKSSRFNDEIEMPVMSDQMLDRLKASADKKAKKMQDQQ